jgi:MFS family permease
VANAQPTTAAQTRDPAASTTSAPVLLAGVAPSASLLITARVLQGLAAAVMLPQVLASISVWFPEEKRAAAFGLFGAVSGVGGIAAPLISGVLIDANVFGLHWRPIFLINIPIGIATLVAALLVVDESTSPRVMRLDPLGVLASGLAVFLLVYPVIQGRDARWATWVWVLLALSLPTLVVFLFLQRWKAGRDNSPVVDLALFRVRGFTAGLMVTVVFFAGVTATAFVLMVFLQAGMGYNALRAGASLVPVATGLVAGSGLSIGLSNRLGRAVLQVGSLVAVGGALWLAILVGDRGTALNIWGIVPPLAVLGVGLGVLVAPLQDFVLTGIPVRSIGSASGLQATMIQVGSAVGVAVLGALFFQYIADGISYSISLRRILYYDAAVFAVTGLLVFLMPRRSARRS